jgi:hypothetical protein
MPILFWLLIAGVRAGGSSAAPLGARAAVSG